MDTRSRINLFHVIVVTALFLYVGFQRTEVYPVTYPVLLGLGVIVLLYHSYESYSYYMEGKKPWVNLIHVLLVAPLMILIGSMGMNTPSMYYDMLLMLGFAAFGYHMMRLLRK